MALDTTHKYGLNADGVLRNPREQAAIKNARDEINKVLAIIERTRW